MASNALCTHNACHLALQVMAFFLPNNPLGHNAAEFDSGSRRGPSSSYRDATKTAAARAAAATQQMQQPAAVQAQHEAERALLEKSAKHGPSRKGAELQMAVLAGAEAAGAVLHCFWCGTLQAGPAPKWDSPTPTWKSAQKDGQARRFCVACRTRVSKNNLKGDRQAVKLCPNGCAGCAGW